MLVDLDEAERLWCIEKGSENQLKNRLHLAGGLYSSLLSVWNITEMDSRPSKSTIADISRRIRAKRRAAKSWE